MMLNPDFDTEFEDAVENGGVLPTRDPDQGVWDYLDGGTTMINTGELVLVEVHGLPGNDVKEFTYKATYPVTEGQQVQVPAPEWSIRVTGREELPGFVLGRAFSRTGEQWAEGDLRDIIPEPVALASAEADSQAAARKLVDEWRETARELMAAAYYHDALAAELEDRLNGELGF